MRLARVSFDPAQRATARKTTGLYRPTIEAVVYALIVVATFRFLVAARSWRLPSTSPARGRSGESVWREGLRVSGFVYPGSQFRQDVERDAEVEGDRS
jgi:hypothetical protein